MIKFRIFHSLNFLLSLLVCSQLGAQTDSPYEREYPVMQYGSASLQDSITALQAQLDQAAVSLNYSSERGYLDSLLQALDIDQRSQLLVFSRTSLQQHLISPQNPRAIYFNDNTYVAWVQGSNSLEVAAMDPNLGPVFYTLSQTEIEKPQFNREFRQCLRCHDSLSLTGGGTPRFMMSSNYTGVAGQLVSHEGSIMTTSRTPISSRWGGWYVSGFHGEQRHLGNVLIETADDVSDENLALFGNKESVAELTNVSPYITPYSDIVALLVVEHQIEVQNQIARVNYYSRTLLVDDQLDPIEVSRALEVLNNDLLGSLFMVGQPDLVAPIEGSSGFSDYFSTSGLKDEQGRSLRELDLQTRLFKYPLSYLVNSAAVSRLPEEILALMKAGITDILAGNNPNGNYSHLSAQDRAAIDGILKSTTDLLD